MSGTFNCRRTVRIIVADHREVFLLGISVLTALLVYSYSDKNKDKFKEILQSLTGSKSKNNLNK
jgi:hypothetical protein